MIKRLDNIIRGSSPSSSRWDLVGSSDSTLASSNWDMINNAIKDHEGDPWYIPKEDRYNAWTCLVISTVGNIDLRDFDLERKFADMRHERVEEYDRKWEEALDRNDTDYLSKHSTPGLGMVFWSNWSAEEIAYYSDENRFPILKDEKYRPMWDLNHPNRAKQTESK